MGSTEHPDLSQFTSHWQDLMCNLYNDCSYACYLPGNHQSLYIQSTNTFYDIEYLDWTCGNNGGGSLIVGELTFAAIQLTPGSNVTLTLTPSFLRI